MKHRIFIGSSTEELKLANKVKELIEVNPELEAIVWNETLIDKVVFDINHNYLDSLFKAALVSDFGILLGTKSDNVMIRGVQEMAPRDNILFEFGLFLGQMGKNNCAIIAEKETKLPSDLQGIEIKKFKANDKESIISAVNETISFFLKPKVKQHNSFPSVVLAATYYRNFLYPLCSYLLKEGYHVVDDRKYDEFEIHILLPVSIGTDLNSKFERIKCKLNTKSTRYPFDGRVRNFDVEVKEGCTRMVVLDLPTIISGIEHSISILLPHSSFSKDFTFQRILEREILRFKHTLESLLESDNFLELIKFKCDSDYL